MAPAKADVAHGPAARDMGIKPPIRQKEVNDTSANFWQHRYSVSVPILFLEGLRRNIPIFWHVEGISPHECSGLLERIVYSQEKRDLPNSSQWGEKWQMKGIRLSYLILLPNSSQWGEKWQICKRCSARHAPFQTRASGERSGKMSQLQQHWHMPSKLEPVGREVAGCMSFFACSLTFQTRVSGERSGSKSKC